MCCLGNCRYFFPMFTYFYLIENRKHLNIFISTYIYIFIYSQKEREIEASLQTQLHLRGAHFK